MAVNLLDPKVARDPNAYMQQAGANAAADPNVGQGGATPLSDTLGAEAKSNLSAALTATLPGAGPGASAPAETGTTQNTPNKAPNAVGVQTGTAAPTPTIQNPIDPTVLKNTGIDPFAFNETYKGIDATNLTKFAGYDAERASAKGAAKTNYDNAVNEAGRLKDLAIQKLMDRLASQGMGESSVALNEQQNLLGGYANQLQGYNTMYNNDVTGADRNWMSEYSGLNQERAGLFAKQGGEEAAAAREAARIKAQGEADAAQAERDRVTQDLIRQSVVQPPAAPTYPQQDPSAIFGVDNGAGGQTMVNHQGYLDWINQVAPSQASFNQLGNVFVKDKGLAPDIHDAIGRRLYGMYNQTPTLGNNVVGSPGFNFGTGDASVPLAPWMDPRYGGVTPQVPGMPM